MKLAFNPADVPMRLFRYVQPGVLPDNVLCIFDPTQNLQIINKELYDQLSDVDQKILLRTQRTSIVFEEFRSAA